MSVLTVFEATPNRVRSLTRLVHYLGPTQRDELFQHLMPSKADAAQFGPLLRETGRLKLVEDRKGEITLGSLIESAADIASDQQFVLRIEMELMRDSNEEGGNGPFRFALAWLLAQESGQPIPWSSEDQHLVMKDQMEGTDRYDITNKARFAMLCYWARYLGYAAGLNSRDGITVIPDPTEAIARRLQSVFAETPRQPIGRFLEKIAVDCPVLEGGAARSIVEARFRRKRSELQISTSTALALWRLEERKLIKIDHASDAETWLLPRSTTAVGAGSARNVSHIEMTG
jgi:hypothetical protein